MKVTAGVLVGGESQRMGFPKVQLPTPTGATSVEHAVRIQLGPVACGRVGSPGDERFDVYGETVNRAAMMQGRSFAVGASLFDLLEAKSKRSFKRLNEDEFVLVK